MLFRSSAKVWINLNGATAAARDSLNVSSVTDVSGGRNQPNYTTSFSAATYAICISGNGGSGNGTIYQTSDIAVGSFIMDYRYNSSGSTYTTYRSEEHTSELQSRLQIVCRLLLEKKKQNKK